VEPYVHIGKENKRFLVRISKTKITNKKDKCRANGTFKSYCSSTGSSELKTFSITTKLISEFLPCQESSHGRKCGQKCVNGSRQHYQVYLPHGVHAIEPGEQCVRIADGILCERRTMSEGKKLNPSKLTPSDDAGWVQAKITGTHLIIAGKDSSKKQEFIWRQSLDEESAVIGFEKE